MATQSMGNGERLLRTFLFCSMSSLGLMCCGYLIYFVEPGGLGPGVYSQTWMWVFAFPAVLAGHLGIEPPALVLLLLMNPLIYGLIGTLAWRMWRSSRQPFPEE